MNPSSARYRDRRTPQAPVNTSPVGDIVPPSDLTEAGMCFWETHCERLKREGLLNEATATRFADLCRFYSQLRAIQAQLLDEGLVLDSAAGRHSNPIFKMFCETEKIVSALSKDFGLTPLARARLNMPRESQREPNALELFIARRP